MKLSMMSYTIARRPDLFDLDRMLRLTRELDLAGIDFVTLHGEDARDLRRRADDHGVPVVCHTFKADLNHSDPESRRAALDDCRRGFEAATVLGAPAVMIPTPGKKDRARDASRANWIAGLKEAAPLAGAAGLVLTVENFPGAASPFVTAADFLAAAAAVPSLRLTYDNGNAATGEDPAASFGAVATLAVHAHFKDWEIRADAAEGFKPMLDGRFYRPALIGEGDVDHAACLAAMAAAGYDGCVNIEYEGSRYDPYEATRRAVDHLRRIAAPVGG